MKNKASFLNKNLVGWQLQKELWKNINSSPSYYTKREVVIRTIEKTRFEIWPFQFFWRFLQAQMAKLSLIDFRIGLPINPYVNDGQNKLQKLISKQCG